MSKFKGIKVDIGGGDVLDIGHCVRTGEFYIELCYMDIMHIKKVIDGLTELVVNQENYDIRDEDIEIVSHDGMTSVCKHTPSGIMVQCGNKGGLYHNRGYALGLLRKLVRDHYDTNRI